MGEPRLSATMVPPGAARGSARRFLIIATNEGGGDIQPLLAIAAGLLARGLRGRDRAAQDGPAGHQDHSGGHRTEPWRDVRRLRARGRSPAAPRAWRATARPAVRLGRTLSPVHRRRHRRTAPRRANRGCVRQRPDPSGRRAPRPAVGERQQYLLHRPRSPAAAGTRLRPAHAGVPRLLWVEPQPGHFVLHASDREFDFGFDRMPPHHHYTGPLFWDPRPTWNAPAPLARAEATVT
jgi:hypothetical protein